MQEVTVDSATYYFNANWLFCYLHWFTLNPQTLLHWYPSTSFVPSLYIKSLSLLEYSGFNYQTKMAYSLQV